MDIELWILFVICILVLGIFYFQTPMLAARYRQQNKYHRCVWI
ncbi:hypothetical protein D1AOALGA4SA_6755 [Olavius algarvensis Delta 1 endosymbiont]|nr:hypothetical protein D1AOALGA4SA_6755 [Olavius algarvensis Delta 1 endosymbiont]